MTVQVRIPAILRSGTGGRIIGEDGRLRRFVSVYVGDEDVRVE